MAFEVVAPEALLLLVSVLVTGCACSNAAGDGSSDSATPDGGEDVISTLDAGDASDDALVDRDGGPIDATEPTDGGTDDPVLTVIDATPCEPWDVRPPAIARGLPADPTPRQLWRYFAYDDPLYVASGLIDQVVDGGPTIGPDGNLYLIGPEQTRVMSLDREGRLRWISEDLRAYLFPPLVASVDGYVRAIGVSGGDTSGVFTIDSTSGTAVGSSMLPGEYPFGLPLTLALGPLGDVYATSPDGRVIATCSNGRLRWLLDMRGRRSAAAISELFTMPDGSLWITRSSDRAFHVTSDGTVLESLPSPDGATRGSARYTDGAQVLFTTFASMPDVWGAFLWRDGMVERSLPLTDVRTSYVLDPLGAVWTVSNGTAASETRRYVDGVVQWDVPGSLLDRGGNNVWSDDASAVVADASLRRILSTGALAWSLDFEGLPGAEPTTARGDYAITLAPDGVAYVQASQGANNYVLAFQTDVLPAPATSCGVPGCNAHRHRCTGCAD